MHPSPDLWLARKGFCSIRNQPWRTMKPEIRKAAMEKPCRSRLWACAKPGLPVMATGDLFHCPYHFFTIFTTPVLQRRDSESAARFSAQSFHLHFGYGVLHCGAARLCLTATTQCLPTPSSNHYNAAFTTQE